MVKQLGVWGWAAVALALLVAIGWAFRPAPPAQTSGRLETLAPLPAANARAIPDPVAAAAPEGEWTMPLGDYAATRYSALAEINPANVARLRPVFTYDTGIPRGHEAPPLVVGGTMYLVTPFPNQVVALDLTRPDHAVKWTYRAPVQQRAQGVACCDVVNRGAAFADGRLFFNSLDGQTIALDAATGRELWRGQLRKNNIGGTNHKA